MVTFVTLFSNKLHEELDDINVCLCFIGMLRSVGECFVVDIPGQHIVLILKGKAVYKTFGVLACMSLKYRANTLS